MLWWARQARTKEVNVPCPVCFGKKRVTLILGDDSEVSIACDHCGRGWVGPRDYVIEHQPIMGPVHVCITAIKREETSEGTKVEYRVGPDRSYSTPNLEDLFATEAEAQARCDVLAAELTAKEECRVRKPNGYVLAQYAWSAGHHTAAAADARRSIEYHERMAIMCKERGRAARKEIAAWHSSPARSRPVRLAAPTSTSRRSTPPTLDSPNDPG